MKVWTCPAGTFQGTESELCYQLRGIRYAYADRFCEPMPYRYAEGVCDCTVKAPYACQLPSKTEKYLFGIDYKKVKQEESCQYLSMSIPKKNYDKTLPVMVWIHGGAFRNGGCDHDCYDSDLLSSEGNVIVVRVNYRLGVLGFVKDKYGQPANLGLMDVILALEWIQENIESFGGDKDRVTLFGQSAGAQIIAGIMVADGTDHLFQNSIMQSTPLGAMVNRDGMDQKILEELNTLSVDAPSEKMMDKQGDILRHITETGTPKYMPFAPHYGVKPLPSEVRAGEILQERASKHPLLIGCNRREASAYIGNNPVISLLDRFILTRQIIENIIERKSKKIFEDPSRIFATQYASAGGQCWYYDFFWGEDYSVIGSCHCMELIPLFGGKGLEGKDIMISLTEQSVRLCGMPLRRAWTDFAKTGYINKNEIEGMIKIWSINTQS